MKPLLSPPLLKAQVGFELRPGLGWMVRCRLDLSSGPGWDGRAPVGVPVVVQWVNNLSAGQGEWDLDPKELLPGLWKFLKIEGSQNKVK